MPQQTPVPTKGTEADQRPSEQFLPELRARFLQAVASTTPVAITHDLLAAVVVVVEVEVVTVPLGGSVGEESPQQAGRATKATMANRRTARRRQSPEYHEGPICLNLLPKSETGLWLGCRGKVLLQVRS